MITENHIIDYFKNLTTEIFLDLPMNGQQKIRNIIILRKENILRKIENTTFLTYEEKEFFYKNSNDIAKNYLTADYPQIFDDLYFLELQAKYRLTLKNKHAINCDIMEQDKFCINNHLASLDMKRLEFFFTDWIDQVIKNDNLHKEQNKLKNEIKKETNNQIRDYESDLSKNFKTLNTNYSLESSYTMLILHSKFVYLLCIRIIETFNTNNNFHKLILNNTEIRFTQMCLVHILIRHYSPLSKISEHIIKKSNHELDFPPEHIHLQLEKIFNDINNSSVVNNINLFENLDYKKNTQINFQFKGNTYRVWVSLNQNQNEKGSVSFKQIETFHLLDDEIELNKMKSNFKKEKINDELYLYVPKTN